jgi:hypothetical protein
MSTVTIEVPRELHERIAVCIAERDRGMALAEESDRSGWNKALIDQAIDAMADTGEQFSANDVRILLPDDVPTALIGNRFNHAATNRGVIRFLGYVRSTKRNTHNKQVGLWVGVRRARSN